MKPSNKQIQWRSFAFFSSNLHKLMPRISFSEHAALFKKANEYRQIATDDAMSWKKINALQTAKEIQSWMKEPGIVAAFHTGPYRMLTMWLMQQRMPLTLVVSADVARKQGAHNRAWHTRIAGTTQQDLFEATFLKDICQNYCKF